MSVWCFFPAWLSLQSNQQREPPPSLDSGIQRGRCWSANLSPRILRFLQTAEMVKPSTPSPSHESSSSSGSDEGAEYYPHLGERLPRGPEGWAGGAWRRKLGVLWGRGRREERLLEP